MDTTPSALPTSERPVLGPVPEHVRRVWGRQTVCLPHTLHEDPLFDDESLARILDAAPASHLALNTMAETGYGPGTWSHVDRAGATGEELVRAIHGGRLWINLTRAHEVSTDLADLLDRMYAELRAAIPGFAPYRTVLGLLVSSPRARVLYHADLPGQGLWQLRGTKKVWLYPPGEPFLVPADMEGIARGTTEEDVPYEPWFDEHADVRELHPGQMLHWPLNAPHRIENGDALSVSLTTEHWTPEVRRNFGVLYANSVLRARGRHPRGTTTGLGGTAKMGATFLHRRFARGAVPAPDRTPRFRIDPAAPHGLAPLEEAR